MTRIIKAVLVTLLLGVVVSSPFWYGMISKPQITAEPEIHEKYKECVKSKDYMRANHMKLLNEWRDEVVRGGFRGPLSIDGKSYKKSLSGGCLTCHDNKDKFCDRCHTAVSVTPSCWNCHLIPKEKKRGN